MRCTSALPAVLLLVVTPLAHAEAGQQHQHPRQADCVAVWVYPPGQAARCNEVDLQAQLRQHPKVCPAASAELALVTVRLTSCRVQVPAVVEPPELAVAGREFVVRAQATEGKAAKELAGLNGDSWAGAARDLCRAIAVWHATLAESH